MRSCCRTSNKLHLRGRGEAKTLPQLTKCHPFEEETCGLYGLVRCLLLTTKCGHNHCVRLKATNTMCTLRPARMPVSTFRWTYCPIYTEKVDAHQCVSNPAMHGFHSPACFQPGRLNARLWASLSLLPASCMTADCRAAAKQDPGHWHCHTFRTPWDTAVQFPHCDIPMPTSLTQ